MPLLNYTTSVEAVRTAALVIEILVKAGARQVMTTYDDSGRPVGLAFATQTVHGVRTFTLPVNAAAVEIALRKDRVPPRYQGRAQAERVAWRIMKDWVEAQLAIVRTGMVTFDQIMLPFMHAEGGLEGRTVYEMYVDQQLALPERTEA